MNMKDNIDRLLEAIEYPDRFSDEEIREMFDNDEARTLYNLMNKTADAMTETNEPDIDSEWKCFVRNQSKSALSMRRIVNPMRVFFNRNAAAILVCVVASLAVVAATIGVTHTLEHPGKADEPSAAVVAPDRTEQKDTATVSAAMQTEPQTVIFKDEPFIAMIRTIADYYGATVNSENEKYEDLHLYFQWDQALPLCEIVDQLNNFEQINIKLTDNAITIE